MKYLDISKFIYTWRSFESPKFPLIIFASYLTNKTNSEILQKFYLKLIKHWTQGKLDFVSWDLNHREQSQAKIGQHIWLLQGFNLANLAHKNLHGTTKISFQAVFSTILEVQPAKRDLLAPLKSFGL